MAPACMVVPGHPLGGVPCQLGGMPLQLGEVVEGVSAAEFTGMNQASCCRAHATTFPSGCLHRARIAAAKKAWWAKQKGKPGSKTVTPVPKKTTGRRPMSAATGRIGLW